MTQVRCSVPSTWAQARTERLAIARAPRREMAGGEWLCECGARMRAGATCCERCDFLDAPCASRTVGAILELMRDVRWVTHAELVEATGAARETVYRIVADLMRTGRVTKSIEQLEAHDFRGEDNVGCAQRALYRLTDERADAPTPTVIRPKTAEEVAAAHGGMTRVQVARMLGVSLHTVSAWRAALEPRHVGNFVVYDRSVVEEFARVRGEMTVARRDATRLPERRARTVEDAAAARERLAKASRVALERLGRASRARAA